MSTDWATLLRQPSFSEPVPTQIQVTIRTLDTIKRVYGQQPPSHVAIQAWGVPIVVVDDLQDGQARFTYSDGTVKVVP